MQKLQIRRNVLGYARDSYLGQTPESESTLPRIDCSIGSSQWGMSERALRADLQLHTLASYGELTYERLLKPVILARFKARGVTPANLFFGHGSFNLAERIIHKMIEPSIMLGVGPQFNEIPSEFEAAGGSYEPVFIQPPAYGFPLNGLLERIRLGVSIVYIDNPNNPLGRVVELPYLAEIARRAARIGAVLVVDEAYGDFVDDSRSAVHLVSSLDNVIVLRSLSKCLGLAAARVGYLFMSDRLADVYVQLDVPFEPALPSAILARATLEDSEFLGRVRQLSIATKHEMIPCLLEAGFSVLPTDAATSIMTVRGPEGSDAARRFASVGVIVEPGSVFRKTHPGWDDSYCRVRLPPQHQRQELQTRLRMIRTQSKE